MNTTPFTGNIINAPLFPKSATGVSNSVTMLSILSVMLHSLDGSDTGGTIGPHEATKLKLF